jgi:hypothetical protein
MSFDPISNPIDFVMIAGRRTPGVVEFTFGSGSPRQWDERRGIDMSGATLRFRGKKLASFTLKLKLATSEDFAAWGTFSPTVLAMPTGGRGALDVVHPILEDLGIRSAVVEDVIPPMPDGDNGGWVVEIKMKERRPPMPAGNTVRGSVNSPSPNPLQLEIESNTQQIRMLDAEAARYR